METKYLRTKDTAKLLGLGLSTLFDWTNPKSPRYKADFPKAKKIGRSTFYDRNEIITFMQQTH